MQPRGAGSRAAGHLICNQTLAYIRGVWTLSLGDPIHLLLPPLDEQLEERCNHCEDNRKQAGSRGFTSGVEGPELG
jgi:hypothetical protein